MKAIPNTSRVVLWSACVLSTLGATSPKHPAFTPHDRVLGDAVFISAPQERFSRRDVVAQSGPVAASQDTFCLYGCPGTNEGTFQTASLAPDRQGWIGVDLTDVSYWQVSEFNAENLNAHGVGNHAMWAGYAVDQQPGWVTPPGYGNDWNARLEWRSGSLVDPSVGQSVELDFHFNHDTEPGYDFFLVQYDSAGFWKTILSLDGSNQDLAGVFQIPGVRFSETAAMPIFFAGDDYGGEQGDEIVIRFVVQSDVGWSDQDGIFDSDGAAQVDDVTVSWSDGGAGRSSFEDFEGAAPFAWREVKPPFVGEFSQVFPNFQDIDPCAGNDTPIMVFVDDGTPPRNDDNCCPPQSTGGETSPNWSYGVPGGWVVNYNGGLSFGGQFLYNEVWSPPIAWDVPGSADDDPTVLGLLIHADLWVHTEVAAMIFPIMQWRESVDGGVTWEAWKPRFFLDPAPRWTRVVWRDNVPSPPTHIQLALGVKDLSWAFGGGYDSTPSPGWDNVRVEKFRITDVEIGRNVVAELVDGNLLAADKFPATGGLDVSSAAARDQLDVAFDRSRPADALDIEVQSLVPGATVADARMVWVLDKNPFFEDTLRSAPSGPNDENVDATDPLRWTGEVVGVSSTGTPGPVSGDTFRFGLPDQDFLYPGDVLRYHFRAEDSTGRMATFPPDLSGFADGAGYDGRFTVRCLPSIRSVAGDQPPILVLVGDEAGPRSSHLRALEESGYVEGLDFDIYAQNRHAPSGVGSAANGATAAQISNYSCILVVNDDAGLIVRLKTHDLELLTQWHDLPGSRAAVYFGEDVVSHVVDYAGAAGEVYAATILGVTLNDEDVSDEIGGQLVPVVRSVTPWFATEFAVDGGCSSGERRIFDSISPLAPAYASHGFVDGTGNTTTSPAGGVVHERQVNGDRKVDITFPFPLTRVQNVMHKAGLPSTRAQLMREILEFAGSIAPGGIPTGVDMSEPLLSVMRSYPNPFNPEVTIRFRLARELPVELKVFDIRGQRVATLMDADLHAGEHRVVWNGQDEHRRDVSSGVYIVRLRAGGVEHTEKISLLK